MMTYDSIVNLTPHSITIRVGDRDIAIPPSGNVARVMTPLEDAGSLQLHDTECGWLRLPTTQGAGGTLEGLPAERIVAGITPRVYPVSGMVLAHPDVATRRDVVAPATGPADAAVRNEAGQVVAVTRLRRPPQFTEAGMPRPASAAARDRMHAAQDDARDFCDGHTSPDGRGY